MTRKTRSHSAPIRSMIWHMEWNGNAFMEESPARPLIITVQTSITHHAHRSLRVQRRLTNHGPIETTLRTYTDTCAQTCTSGQGILSVLQCSASYLCQQTMVSMESLTHLWILWVLYCCTSYVVLPAMSQVSICHQVASKISNSSQQTSMLANPQLRLQPYKSKIKPLVLALGGKSHPDSIPYQPAAEA